LNSEIERRMLTEENKNDLINHLIDTYGFDLKKIAAMYINDQNACEDIVQDVFISAYHHLHTFRQESQYKTWLIRITINKCKDYKKKWNTRNLLYTTNVEMENLTTSYEKSPSDLLEEKENTQLILHSIHQLPSKYTEILILHYFQQLTLKEISIISKMKINTVKTRILRGKELLKNELMKGGYYFE
jgi:RNA polymerase sigma factor (sigma-70 family)